MNNNSKLLAAVVVVALAFAAIPATQAQSTNDDFGSQVTTDSTEFSVALSVIDSDPATGGVQDAVIETIDIVRHNAGTPDNHFDDVFVLDITDDGDIDQFEYVLATSGYDGTEVGGTIAADMTLLLGNGDADAAEVFTVDANEDGRFTEADHAFICDSADLEATGNGNYCIALTAIDGDNLAAGGLVRTTHDVLDDFGAGGDATAQDNAEFCIFDTDNDGAFQGENDNDLAWIDFDGCANGDLLDLYSIELFGSDMEYGTFVTTGTSAFAVQLTDEPDGDNQATTDANMCWDEDCTLAGVLTLASSPIQFFRHDAGTPDNHFDDVIIYDVDSDDAISQFDYVVATSGYDGTTAGGLIQSTMTLLSGATPATTYMNDAGTTATEAIHTWAIDVDEDGTYNDGDAVVLCMENDATDAGQIFATGAADACVYLTPYDGNAAGDLLRTTDDVIDDWQGSEIALDEAEFGFFDADNDFQFQGDNDGDLAWLWLDTAAGGDSLEASERLKLFSLELSGSGLTYGEQVLTNSDNFVVVASTAGIDMEAVAVTNVGQILRHNAGTPDNHFDDVFVLDITTAGTINQYDLVLATAGYDGTAVGEVILSSMTLLAGSTIADAAVANVASDAFFVDVDEDGSYNEGDYVFLCDTDDTLEATNANDYCIALTPADDLAAGALVRTTSDVLDDWSGAGAAFPTDTPEFCFFDFDGDGQFEGADDGDFAWLFPGGCNVGDPVELFSVRLFGDFSQVPGGANTGTTTTTTSDTTTTTNTTTTSDTTTTDTTTTDATTTDVTTTQTATDDTATDDTTTTTGGTTDVDGDDTPGLGLVALLAALGAALVLVRRKL